MSINCMQSTDQQVVVQVWCAVPAVLHVSFSSLCFLPHVIELNSIRLSKTTAHGGC